MPNHLEYVVRPSQAPQIRPGTPTQLFATPAIPENAPITWGSPGDSVFDSHAHAQVELPQPKFESSRTYDVVRVFNPDDHSQFVDTEQMTEYTGTEKNGGQALTLRFASQPNTSDTQVMQRGLVRRS